MRTTLTIAILLLLSFAAPSFAADESQLVVAPAPVLGKSGDPSRLPQGWDATTGADHVSLTADGIVMHSDGGRVAVAATLKRGLVDAGAAYQITLKYQLTQSGGRAALRLRNQIDRDTQSVALPDSPELDAHTFYLVAPADYDVGIYYVEVVIENNGAEMHIGGAGVRSATAQEAAEHQITPTAESAPPQSVVDPDEMWIEAIHFDALNQTASERRVAWGLEAGAATDVPLTLDDPDGSILIHPGAQAIAGAVIGRHGALRLNVTGKAPAIPGGYGLNPLAARSVAGAALLFGVGAADTGWGSYTHQRLCKIAQQAGAFDDGTTFFPFWSLSGTYAARAKGATPDFPQLYAGEPNSPPPPELGFTAPGVLVSGYRHQNTLLLVLANDSDQPQGKLGDLWIDLDRIFAPGKKINPNLVHIEDAETDAATKWAYNRNGGGFIPGWVFNIAIPPGDVKLLRVEVGP